MSLSLLKLKSIESVMPSSHLILCRFLLFLLSIFSRPIRVFFSDSAPHIRWPKYWSLSISSSNEYSGLISFRIDRFDFLTSLRDSQKSSPTPQFKSINSLTFSLPYGPTLQSIHDLQKNHRFDYIDLCQQSSVLAF